MSRPDDTVALPNGVTHPLSSAEAAEAAEVAEVAEKSTVLDVIF